MEGLRRLSLKYINFTRNDIDILRRYISPGRALEKVSCFRCLNVDLMLPNVFGLSSLKSLIVMDDTYQLANVDVSNINVLIQGNSNLKNIKIDCFSLQLPTYSLCDSESIDFVVKYIVMLAELLHFNLRMQKVDIEITFFTEPPEHFYVFGIRGLIEHEKMQVSKKTMEVEVKPYSHCPNVTQQILQRIPQ